MTLITHIWNGNQTILVGDGREMSNGKVISDDTQKIFINKTQKFGLALQGNLNYCNGNSPYNHLYNLVISKTTSHSLIKFSTDVKKSFQKNFSSTDAILQIGGFDNNKQRAIGIPLNLNPKVNQINSKGRGAMISSNNEGHLEELIKLFQKISKTYFGELLPWDQPDLNPNKISNFFGEFYASVYKSRKTNPTQGIGPTVDCFLITPKKVTCLRNDNKLRFDFI